MSKDTNERLLILACDGLIRYAYPSGEILWSNKGFAEIVEFDGPPENLKGGNIRDFAKSAPWEDISKALEATGEARGFECRIETLKGNEKWVVHQGLLVADNGSDSRYVECAARDVTLTRRADRVLHALLKGTAAMVGDEFFRNLALEIASALQVHCAFLGEIVPEDKNRVRTIAVCVDGKLADNFEYDVRRAPCGNVIGKQFRWYPREARRMFPNDEILSRMDAVSYAAAPIFTATNYPLGILGVIDKRPMPESDAVRSILTIFAERAGVELEREYSEEATRENEMRYRRLLASVTDYVYTVVIENGKPVQTSHGRGCEGVTGYTPEDYAADPGLWYRMVHVDDRTAVTTHANTILTSKTPLTLEHRLTHKNGSVRWVRNTLVPRHDDLGALVAYDGIVTDITERKRAEDELSESHAFLRNVIDSLPEFVSVRDINGKFVLGNKALAEACGVTVESLLGRGEIDFSKNSAQAEKSRGDDIEVIRTRKPKRIGDEEFTDADGRARWLVSYKLPLFEKDGDCSRVLAIGRDITERKKAEEATRRLAAAVNAAAESIIITDAGGNIEYVNPCFERMTGYSPDEMIGKNVRILKSGKHTPQFYTNMWSMIAAGSTWHGRFTNRKKDGTLFEEDATISPVRDASGKIMNFVAVKRDVTQEVMLENELRHSQKMEAIGRLAGGVAHDFTNMLVVILNCAEMVKAHLPAESPDRVYLDSIIESANRSGKLSGQLLAFAHRQAMSMRVTDLNKVLRNMEDMVRRTMKADIVLSIHRINEVLPVKIDSSQIEQIIIHMVVNAQDSIPEGGRVTLETFRVFFSKAEAAQLQEGVNESRGMTGAFAALSISDTGCGMTEEVRRRAFDPFFTTKDAGSSTGLGLSTCYGIMKQHGGLISVHTDRGTGTTFTIYLPLVDQSSAKPPESEEPQESLKGSETILVAEDNILSRKALIGMLQQLGYSVIEAEDAKQALEVARKTETPIHLLLASAILPGMTGSALADAVRSFRPDIKVILASGHPKTHLKEQGLIKEEDIFINKPYFLNSLGRFVRVALDAGSRRSEVSSQ